MSRHGNCYDNAMAENFFSILKIEYISRLKPTTFAEAREDIDSYIYFYNHRSYPVKNWSGAAHAAPLRLKLNFSYQGTFLCYPYNWGQYIIRCRGFVFVGYSLKGERGVSRGGGIGSKDCRCFLRWLCFAFLSVGVPDKNMNIRNFTRVWPRKNEKYL